jgi:dihydroceramidase
MPPPPPHGYWGAVTADYNWCEQDYKITPYVAEFFNTVSSLAVALAGVIFGRQARAHKYGVRFQVAAAGLIIIGLGSVAFHGTLQRWGQVLDEVPMLWSSLVFLWIAVCNALGRRGEAAWSARLAGLLGGVGAGSTWVYFNAGFGFFLVTYVVTVFAIFTVTLVRASCYAPERNAPARKYAYLSVAFYGAGFFFLWIPEQVFCGNRIHDTHLSGLLALPIPLHAFFHITSSIGPLCFLNYVVFDYLEKRKRRPAIVSERAPEFCRVVSIPVITADLESEGGYQ